MVNMRPESDPTDDTVVLYTTPDDATMQFAPLTATQTAPPTDDSPQYWQERYRRERSRKSLFLGTTIGASLLAVGLAVVLFTGDSGRTWAANTPEALPSTPASSAAEDPGQSDGQAADQGQNDSAPGSVAATPGLVDPQSPDDNALGALGDSLPADSPQLRHLIRELLSGRHDRDELLAEAVQEGLLSSEAADQIRQYLNSAEVGSDPRRDFAGSRPTAPNSDANSGQADQT